MKQVLYPRKDILVRNLKAYSKKVYRLSGENPDCDELSSYAVHCLGFKSEVVDRIPRLGLVIDDAVKSVLSR